MRAPTANAISQGSHGTSKAVDYRAVPDINVYAPEDGTIDSYQRRGSGTNDAGNALRMRGATGLHQFAHLEESYVSPGQKVVKGQRIAKMGYTGYTKPSGPAGRHLHYWVQTGTDSKGSPIYVYPPNLINEPFGSGSTGSSKMTRAEAESVVKAMYRGLFGREADAGGLNNYAGHMVNGNFDFIFQDMVKSQEFKNKHVKTVEKVVEKPVGTPTNPKAEALYNAVREAVK